MKRSIQEKMSLYPKGDLPIFFFITKLIEILIKISCSFPIKMLM